MRVGGHSPNLPEQHNRTDPDGCVVGKLARECKCMRAGPASYMLNSGIPLPRPFPFIAGRKAGPRSIRVGELSMSTTIYNAWESGHCPLLGQHGNLGSDDKIVGERS